MGKCKHFVHNARHNNREYMDQAGCTNTGIISNEISDINVCTELCGFQNPNLIGNSDKIFKHYIGVDSNTHDNDESDIGNTDNCYQHVRSGESNSTTHFVQVKSEPNICVNSSNHATCTETKFIGSHRSIKNTEVSIKMETITDDAFDPSGCMLTDDLTHKSGKNSLHVHEQLDCLSSNRANYAICIKYEPDSGAEMSRIPLAALLVPVGQKTRRITIISETIVTVMVTIVIFQITP